MLTTIDTDRFRKDGGEVIEELEQRKAVCDQAGVVDWVRHMHRVVCLGLRLQPVERRVSRNDLAGIVWQEIVLMKVNNDRKYYTIETHFDVVVFQSIALALEAIPVRAGLGLIFCAWLRCDRDRRGFSRLLLDNSRFALTTLDRLLLTIDDDLLRFLQSLKQFRLSLNGPAYG